MYKLVLFDVDGVLLSEERYFDATALTVWEMLYSPKYVGVDPTRFTATPGEAEIRKIREAIFIHDEVLSFMKSRGINANWDMVYLSLGHQLIHIMEQLLPEHPEDINRLITSPFTRASFDQLRSLATGKSLSLDFSAFLVDFSNSKAEKQELILYLNQLVYKKLGISTDTFTGTSVLWDLCQETFQEWYLGDDLVKEDIGRIAYQYGKKGFLSDEIPIVEPTRMAEVLAALKEKGVILGIGTGRPTIETIIPLRELGLLQYFDPNRVITATHVLQAEDEFPDHAPLNKPQPFSYIKGWLGLDRNNSEVLECGLPLDEADKLLIVGDSIADYMAAKSIGCHFAATLTGLSGKEARSKFEELQAEYILDDMSEILSIWHEK